MLFQFLITKSYQPNPSSEQVVHHALLDVSGFGEFCFQGGDLGVHVGEHGPLRQDSCRSHPQTPHQNPRRE